jgi:DNA phosphorothioation-dependent restriction protein DptH
MRVLALNPGAGDLLEGMLAPTLVPADDEEELSGEPPPRAEIIAYSDHQPFTTPMRRLRALQERVLSAPTAVRPSHLTPRLGLASRPSMHLLEDDEGHHLAVLQDLARGALTAVDASGGRTTSFQDLLTPTTTNRLGDAEGVVWQTLPALLSRSSGGGGALVEAHRVHQAGVASELEAGAQVGLEVGLAVVPT